MKIFTQVAGWRGSGLLITYRDTTSTGECILNP